MKVSRNWLQTYFQDPLPDAETLSDALTFHVFEIDGVEHVGEDDVLDVKITANRGHDCLSHRGIAKELSAILDMPMIRDPLRMPLSLEPKTDALSITIEDTSLCTRFTAALIKNVNVGPSPEWLRKALEAVGQRSINNIVDATNYVMLNIGQPLHAFDTEKLGKTTGDGSMYVSSIAVRRAREGEKLVGLDDKEYALSTSMLVIADLNNGDAPISIAGIKGGKPTGIDSATKNIILEAANWNGVAIRKTSQALKLRTDASARFEQVISPELTAYAIRDVADLIQNIAGGEVVGFYDQYPVSAPQQTVAVSLDKINAVLGASFKGADVEDVWRRLDFAHTQEGDTYTIHAPFERLDLTIPEDLVEEVGRIIGYDKIVAVELPSLPEKPAVNQNFYAAEKVREELIAQGYSEVFTSVFAEKGERVVLNKVDGVRPRLRANLVDGLAEALKKNIPNKDLLGIKEVKLFEIGTVWRDGGEILMIGTISENEPAKEMVLDVDMGAEQYEQYPLSSTVRYKTFSKYPYIVRDISFWLPIGNSTQDYIEFINTTFKTAGNSLGEALFWEVDEYEKDSRKSITYRLIFQSSDRTLTDIEVNAIMDTVADALRAKGFEIR